MELFLHIRILVAGKEEDGYSGPSPPIQTTQRQHHPGLSRVEGRGITYQPMTRSRGCSVGSKLKPSTWRKNSAGWRGEIRDRSQELSQKVTPSNPPKPASPLTAPRSATWTRTSQSCSRSSRPSAPRKPNSFSSLRRARPSLPSPPEHSLAHLQARPPGTQAPGSPARLGSPRPRGLSLTNLRRSGSPESPGIGHCGSRRTLAA